MSRVKVQTPEGKMVILDQIKQDAFDTISIASGAELAGSREFFSNIQGKHPFQTNLNQSNILEKNVSFMVTGMQIDCQGADTLNLAKLQEFTALRLKIGERDFWKGNMRFATGKIESEIGTVDAQFAQFGKSYEGGVHFGKNAHEIPSLFTFKVVMDTVVAGNSTEDLNVICRLKGLQRRPVQ